MPHETSQSNSIKEAFFGPQWSHFTTLADAVLIVDPGSGNLMSSLEEALTTACGVANRIQPVGHLYTDDYDFRAIHALLIDSFTDADLRRFCRHHREFQGVCSRFGSKYALDDMIDVLLEYCSTRALLRKLLLEIEQERPAHFGRHRNHIFGGSRTLVDADGFPLSRGSEAADWETLLTTLEAFCRESPNLQVNEALRKRLRHSVAGLVSKIVERVSTYTHLTLVGKQLGDLVHRLYA